MRHPLHSRHDYESNSNCKHYSRVFLTMQVQHTVFFQFLKIPEYMSHLEEMPAYESVQEDINVG